MARILVVDDEPNIREILTRRLTNWGHDVMAVSSAADALCHMNVAPAQLLFCDILMPVHDGFWLVQQVRSRWPRTVVVMVSGAEELNAVITSRKYGAVDYVQKPVGREMLHQALLRALASLESQLDTASV